MRADALARAADRGGRARLYGLALKDCPYPVPRRLTEARHWERAWKAMDARIAAGEIEERKGAPPEETDHVDD